jgi:hypothetical protein
MNEKLKDVIDIKILKGGFNLPVCEEHDEEGMSPRSSGVIIIVCIAWSSSATL